MSRTAFAFSLQAIRFLVQDGDGKTLAGFPTLAQCATWARNNATGAAFYTVLAETGERIKL